MDIIKWTRHPTHAATLQEFLNSSCGTDALTVLRQMTVLHRATPETTPTQLANDHQFNAGFQACLVAMRNLVNLNPDHLAKLERAREINQTPSWDWVTKNDFAPAPIQPTKSPSTRKTRAKK